MNETAEGCQFILTLNGDGVDHAVVFRGYKSDTNKITVWDPSADREYDVFLNQINAKHIIGVR